MTKLAPLNDLLKSVWADLQQTQNARISEAAKRDPKSQRDCLVFGPGKSMAYRYHENKDVVKGWRVRWCNCSHPNIAGYFLSFIEFRNGKVGTRHFFRGWEKRRDASADCRARWLDSKKPKAERRYTIPTP